MSEFDKCHCGHTRLMHERGGKDECIAIVRALYNWIDKLLGRDQFVARCNCSFFLDVNKTHDALVWAIWNGM